MSFLLAALVIPPVTAFIGYVTNWAAVRMIFHPAEFVGVGRIGWQGVLYRLAPKLASEIARTTSLVLSPADLLARIEPAELEALLGDRLEQEARVLVRDAFEVLRPGSWEQLDPVAQDAAVAQVRAEGKELVVQLLARLREESHELIDLPRLVVQMLSGENAGRLARVSQEIGAKELRFIELYGGVFGLLVGLVQVALYGIFSVWWTMPIVGAIVGLGTNWLAIQMIFRPLEPRRFLGLVTYQGMFPKRQPQIAADYGRIAGEEVITPESVLRIVAETEAGPRIAAMTLQAVHGRVESLGPAVGTLARAEVDEAAAQRLTMLVVERLTATAPELRPDVEAYLAERLAVADTIEERLARLSKPEFERMLRGIFEEDEVILVALGGLLGGIIGTVQGLLVLLAG